MNVVGSEGNQNPIDGRQSNRRDWFYAAPFLIAVVLCVTWCHHLELRAYRGGYVTLLHDNHFLRVSFQRNWLGGESTLFDRFSPEGVLEKSSVLPGRCRLAFHPLKNGNLFIHRFDDRLRTSSDAIFDPEKLTIVLEKMDSPMRSPKVHYAPAVLDWKGADVLISSTYYGGPDQESDLKLMNERLESIDGVPVMKAHDALIGHERSKACDIRKVELVDDKETLFIVIGTTNKIASWKSNPDGLTKVLCPMFPTEEFRGAGPILYKTTGSIYQEPSGPAILLVDLRSKIWISLATSWLVLISLSAPALLHNRWKVLIADCVAICLVFSYQLASHLFINSQFTIHTPVSIPIGFFTIIATYHLIASSRFSISHWILHNTALTFCLYTIFRVDVLFYGGYYYPIACLFVLGAIPWINWLVRIDRNNFRQIRFSLLEIVFGTVWIAILGTYLEARTHVDIVAIFFLEEANGKASMHRHALTMVICAFVLLNLGRRISRWRRFFVSAIVFAIFIQVFLNFEMPSSGRQSFGQPLQWNDFDELGMLIGLVLVSIFSLIQYARRRRNRLRNPSFQDPNVAHENDSTIPITESATS